ncbi:hypothetical protein XANCAGTX0491_008546 [Xanthoria calcicola]
MVGIDQAPPRPGYILGRLPRRNCQQLSCAACFRQRRPGGGNEIQPLFASVCAAAVEMMGDGTGLQTERPGTPIKVHGRTPTTAEYQGLGFHVGALVSASPVA